MKIGEKYRPEKLNPPYDVIVIGSGIGGLSTAAILSKAGKKVLVLEQHYMPGGFTHSYLRKGYEWDVGIHYIGDVHRKNSLLRKIFDYISNGKLEWAFMGDIYDRLIFGDDVYDFHAGHDNFYQKLRDYFPEEEQALKLYDQAVREVNKASKAYFGARALPPFISDIVQSMTNKKFTKYANQTVDGFLRGITKNEKLIGLLAGQWGDYGLPPKQASFAIHALVVGHYYAGGNYPVGGSSQIAKTIEPVIAESGGKILHSAEVKKIIIQRNKAVGVELADGQEILADTIISNAGVINTYEKLMPVEISRVHQLDKKLSQVQHSCAHIGLYIGIRETAQTLGLSKTNLWIYPGYDHDQNIAEYARDEAAELPVVYISFPSAKDPTWDTRYRQKSTIEVVSFAPYEWFAKWEESAWNKRGDDYAALKDHLSLRLLDVLYKWVPQVKGKIDFYELSTPLSTKHFTAYGHGEIYGIDHTPQRFQQKWLRPHTPVNNLFLTGQDIVTNGIGGALMSGVITASAVLKGNIVKKIISSV